MSQKNQKLKSPVREFIALTLVHGLGANRIRLLMRVVDHPQEIFRLGRKALERIEGIGSVLADAILKFNGWQEVDEILDQTHRSGARLISFLDKDYPLLLREIYDPPILLWIRGEDKVLNNHGVAVVGTRRCTTYGLNKAEYFSRALAERGLNVVSGLALGIDAAAHRSTLKKGGVTVAVLGSGINNIYPSTHKGLAKEIVEAGGAVITEYPPETKPDAGNFPVRNRIVSGLTLGTLVVESGIKGGSMITARSALDQNREVFAVPHSLDNRSGVGCNAIIKRGWGKLVQDIEDVMAELPAQREIAGSEAAEREAGPSRPDWRNRELNALGKAICELLESKGSRHIDDISKVLNLPTHTVLGKLLELEMMECIRQTAGKRFELR